MIWNDCTGGMGCQQFRQAWRLAVAGRRFNILIGEKDGQWYIDDHPQAIYMFRELEGVNSLEEAQAIAETIGRLE